jgi:hypothetical protein
VNVHESSSVESKGEECIRVEGKEFDRGTSTLGRETFDSEQFMSELREIWPRSEYGHSSEVAALQALENEKEAGMSMRDSAIYILNRVTQIAGLISKWPRERMHLLPGLTSLLLERRYKQDEAFWEHHELKPGKNEQRQRAIDDVVATVAAEPVE